MKTQYENQKVYFNEDDLTINGLTVHGAHNVPAEFVDPGRKEGFVERVFQGGVIYLSASESYNVTRLISVAGDTSQYWPDWLVSIKKQEID